MSRRLWGRDPRQVVVKRLVASCPSRNLPRFATREPHRHRRSRRGARLPSQSSAPQQLGIDLDSPNRRRAATPLAMANRYVLVTQCLGASGFNRCQGFVRPSHLPPCADNSS